MPPIGLNDIPASMRAVVLDERNTLRLAQLPVPNPAAGEVLVRVHASGVNPLDLKISDGRAPHARHPWHSILGIDAAGTVAAVGPAVDAFEVGDEVYGTVGGVGGHPGSLAEYVVVHQALLAPKPRNLGMRHAASLPLVAITAWEGLVDRARVAPGHSVLVHGGAGGVGSVAIQIARSFGATVFATVRSRQRAHVVALGAEAIDPDEVAVERYVQACTGGAGFDVVFDTVGGTVLDDSFRAVGRFGHVVSALGWGTHALAPLSFQAASYSGVFTLLPLLTGVGREHHGAILRAAAALAERGQLVPRVDPRVYTLETVDAAHAELASGRADGKIVVSLID